MWDSALTIRLYIKDSLLQDSLIKLLIIHTNLISSCH